MQMKIIWKQYINWIHLSILLYRFQIISAPLLIKREPFWLEEKNKYLSIKSNAFSTSLYGAYKKKKR